MFDGIAEHEVPNARLPNTIVVFTKLLIFCLFLFNSLC